MTVKIRLSRGGAKKQPYYRIVVANARAPRDGDFIEKVGTYNPTVLKDNKSRVTINAERISYWLNSGAQPTERVLKFLVDLGISLPAFAQKTYDLHQKTRQPKAAKQKD